MGDPKLLLLDEPTAAINPTLILEIMERYRDTGYERRKLLEDQDGLRETAGIVFRNNGEAVQTEPRQLI